MRQAWAAYELRSTFVTWATEPDGEGVRYAVVERTPCPGIGWVRLRSRAGHIVEEDTSGGAFYDGATDHPEGALGWALLCARAHAARVHTWLTKFDQEVRRKNMLDRFVRRT